MNDIYNFSVEDVSIKSMWFGDRSHPSLFPDMCRENGFNLYLQLFRFRVHTPYQDKNKMYNTHYFRFSLSELIEFSKPNKKKMSYKELVSVLEQLERIGFIKLEGRLNIKEKNRIVLCKATDTPKQGDNWTKIPLYNIQHIMDEGYSSKHIVLYAFMLKFSNGNRDLCFTKRETINHSLGFGYKQIKDMYVDLNELGLIATVENKNTDGSISFVHTVNKKNWQVDKFKKIHRQDIEKFINKN